MKSKKLKLVSTLFVMALTLSVISVTTTVDAKDTSSVESELIGEDETISPCGAVCPRCGGTVVSSTSWGDWYAVGERKCSHGYAWGTDVIQERTGSKSMRCLSCSSGNSSTVKQSRTVCHGYNR